MEELIRHVESICATDLPTLAVILLFCSATAYFLKEYVAPVLAISALPLLVLGSILVHYAFVLGQLYIPNKLDQWLMWTVLASICGNMIGIAIIAAVGRLRDRAVPLHGRNRAARERQSTR